MSRFYAEIHGSAQTSATRCGSASSGISGHIRGWDVGVAVEGEQDYESPASDRFYVYATSGSNGTYGRLLLGVVQLDEEGRPVFKAAIHA